MNRQQRRASTRKPANGGAPEMGQVLRQLQQPQQVGDLTVAEATEIKGLNKLVTKLEEDYENIRQTLIAVRNHRITFLNGLITSRDLDPKQNYNINDDTGLILQTHELVTPVLETVETPAPQEADTEAESPIA